MKLTHQLTSLCSLFIFLFSTHSFATGPRVAPSLFVSDKNIMYALEHPPFVSSKSQQQGLLLELIASALQAEKMSDTINILPSHNMLKYYFSQENALAIIGHDFNLTADERKKAIFIPVLALDEYFYYYQPKQAEALDWKANLNKLKGKTYGANKGDDVSAYQKSGIKIKYARINALVKQLQQGNIDFIRQSEATFSDLMSREVPGQVALFIKMQPKAGIMPMGIVFNTQHDNGAQAAQQFKSGLAKIIANGQYQAIVHKHLGTGLAVDELIQRLKNAQ